MINLNLRVWVYTPPTPLFVLLSLKGNYMEELIKSNIKLVGGELFRLNGEKVNLHKNRYGYVMICIGKKLIQAHRAVFLLDNGYLPEEVDHKDGDRENNHPSNLRASNKSSNKANQSLRSDCLVKFKGVDFHKKTGKYRARIKHKQIGMFDCPKDAAIAYDKEAKRIYGEFAKTNSDMGLLAY